MTRPLRLPRSRASDDARAGAHARLGVVLVVQVALLVGCTLRSIGDPGEPLLSVEYIVEDAAILPEGSPPPAAAWRVDEDLVFAATATDFSRLDVFEKPPEASVSAGATRLEFVMGDSEDLIRLANGQTAREIMARSRAQLWWIHDAAAAVDRVPPLVERALPNLDEQPIPALLVVDSSDPEARRCGDNAVADQLPACAGCAFDGAPADGEDACCATLRADFDACRAVVIDSLGEDQRLPVRLRVLSR